MSAEDGETVIMAEVKRHVGTCMSRELRGLQECRQNVNGPRSCASGKDWKMHYNCMKFLVGAGRYPRFTGLSGGDPFSTEIVSIERGLHVLWIQEWRLGGGHGGFLLVHGARGQGAFRRRLQQLRSPCEVRGSGIGVYSGGTF